MVAHAALHFEQLGHHVQQDVVNVDHDNKLLVTVLSVIVRVIDATALHQRVQSLSHRRHVLFLNHEAVIGIVVESYLLLL